MTRRLLTAALCIFVLIVALWCDARNSIAAQQPVPTATLSLTLIATPEPLPAPISPPWEQLVELIFDKDFASTLIELWQHSWWWFVLFIVWLIVKRIAGKPVNELVQGWINELLNRVRAWMQKAQSAEEQREKLKQSTKIYLEQLRKDFAKTEIIPIAGHPADAIETHNYVPLQVGQSGTTVSESVFRILDADDNSPHGLLLVGAAGSGKSHTLRYAALLLAEAWPSLPEAAVKTLGLQGRASPLPIYVRLQDLSRCRELLRKQPEQESELMLLEVMDHHLHCRTAGYNPSFSKDFVSSHIAADNEQCLFLFDGLDEVDEMKDRQWVQEQIDKLRSYHQRHLYVVTTRPLNDQMILTAKGFTERQLRPLQPEQMQRILFYWYRHVEDGVTPTASDEECANQKAVDLLQSIQGDADLGPMAVNPLFLTAMARMATTDGRLPCNRARKYDRLIKLSLEWRRNRTNMNDPELFHTDHHAVLSKLHRFAACMLINSNSDLSIAAYINGPCATQLCELTNDTTALNLPELELERLFRAIVRHTGLMVEQTDSNYRFSFTLRDYLAACFLVSNWPNAEQRFLTRHVHDPRWRTTMVLSISYHVHIHGDLAPLQGLVAALLGLDLEARLLAAEVLCEAVSEGPDSQLNRLCRSMVDNLRELEADPVYTERANRWLSFLTSTNLGGV